MIKFLNFILRVIRFFERKTFNVIQSRRLTTGDETQSRDLVLIIGAHRSGTSVFTQILSVLGYDLGKTLMPPSFDNPRGFWENQKIVGIHEKLIKRFHKNWTTAGFLPSDWLLSDTAEETVEELEQVLVEDFNKKDPILIKDPRLCMLLPIWQTIAERQKLVLKPLIIIRSPEAVATSISRRNDISLTDARVLAVSYLQALCDLPKDGNTTVVIYERIVNLKGGDILDILGKEDVLPVSFPYQNTVNQIDQIIKSDKVLTNKLPTPVSDAYQRLINNISPTITFDELRSFVNEITSQDKLKEQLLVRTDVPSFTSAPEDIKTVPKEKYDVIVAENERYVEKLDVLTASKFQLTHMISDLVTIIGKKEASLAMLAPTPPSVEVDPVPDATETSQEIETPIAEPQKDEVPTDLPKNPETSEIETNSNATIEKI